jgi:hypothetical protein
MAIAEQHPGLEAGIDINGQRAVEYDDDDDDDEDTTPNTVSKYIEAHSGAEFKIRYRFGNDFLAPHGLIAKAYLDAKHADSIVLRQELFYGRKYRATDMYIRGTREKLGRKYFERKFCFTSLVTGDLIHVPQHVSIADSLHRQ